jgi:hypothetical protein
MIDDLNIQVKMEVPMMDKTKTNKNETLAKIEELEITPLSDAELDSVAGGVTDTTVASCSCCVAGATGREA